MTNLSELADRVEALSGPNYAIEIEIENALGLSVFLRDPMVGFGDAEYTRRPPKAFTASIDAAMTLLPEGWRPVRIVWLPNAVEASIYFGFASATGRAKYIGPAAALTAACLRARSV